MRICKLEMPTLLRVTPFIMLAIFTFVVPVIILTSGGPIFILAPWLVVVVGWNWWALLTTAHSVVVHDDGSLEWLALSRRIRTIPEDIREIRPERSRSIGVFVVKHTGGSIRFINQITGFHEVLVHIKQRNPRVILKGC